MQRDEVYQNDKVYQATTAILRALAKGDYQILGEEPRTYLPGVDTFEKKTLERELLSFAHRIRHLEAKAAAASRNFPDTPNENGAPTSPFGLGTTGRHPSPIPIKGGLAKEVQRNGGSPDSDSSDQSNQFEFLHQCVKPQEQEVQGNGTVMRNLMEEAPKDKLATQPPIDEATKVERLQRELKKSQQANEAFSKALREIGEIVTAGMLNARRADSCDYGRTATEFLSTYYSCKGRFE